MAIHPRVIFKPGPTKRQTTPTMGSVDRRQSTVCTVLSPTVFLVEETEEEAGRELNRSSAECARGGLDTAGLSLLSGTHPPPLDTAGHGAGASNKGYTEACYDNQPLT